MRSLIVWLQHTALLAVFWTLCSAPATAEDAPSERAWAWSVTPYIWLTDTSYKLRADAEDIGSGTVDFGELYDTVDASFQVVIETGPSGGRWSGFVDVTYLSTSDDETVELDGLGSLGLDAKSDQLYIDAAIAFWPWRDVSGFNVYGGVRYTNLDDKTTVDVVDPVSQRLGVIRLDRDYTDALIGVRDIFKLTENWALTIRADYGFGDSEGILMAQTALRWVVGRNRRHGLMVGYRYKEAEFEGDDLDEEYDYKGPVVGFNFQF
jgi:hypothetical protein